MESEVQTPEGVETPQETAPEAAPAVQETPPEGAAAPQETEDLAERLAAVEAELTAARLTVAQQTAATNRIQGEFQQFATQVTKAKTDADRAAIMERLKQAKVDPDLAQEFVTELDARWEREKATEDTRRQALNDAYAYEVEQARGKPAFATLSRVEQDTAERAVLQSGGSMNDVFHLWASIALEKEKMAATNSNKSVDELGPKLKPWRTGSPA